MQLMSQESDTKESRVTLVGMGDISGKKLSEAYISKLLRLLTKLSIFKNGIFIDWKLSNKLLHSENASNHLNTSKLD